MNSDWSDGSGGWSDAEAYDSDDARCAYHALECGDFATVHRMGYQPSVFDSRAQDFRIFVARQEREEEQARRQREEEQARPQREHAPSRAITEPETSRPGQAAPLRVQHVSPVGCIDNPDHVAWSFCQGRLRGAFDTLGETARDISFYHLAHPALTGSGSNGAVFRVNVTDPRVVRAGGSDAAHITFALKLVYNVSGAYSSVVRERFRNEHELMSADVLPAHPNVATLFSEFVSPPTQEMLQVLPEEVRSSITSRNRRSGIVTARSAQMLVLEHHTRTLEEHLDDIGSALSAEESFSLAIQVARGLSHLARHRVCHLDLKLSNFVVSNNSADRADEFRVVLIDFGCAVRVPTDTMCLGELRDVDMVGGNLDHLAPELIAARHEAARNGSAVVDLHGQPAWELGIILHELIAGEHPFPDASLLQDFEIPAYLASTLEEMGSDATVAVRVASLVRQLLSHNPDARPSVFDALSTLLDACVGVCSSDSTSCCCVCLTAPIESTFVPCGHNACCDACANQCRVGGCPICRSSITSVQRTYRQ